VKLRLRYLLVAIAAAVVVAGGLYWFFSTFHQVPFDFRSPPGPEARRNRLLALERTLAARGHTVFNRLRFSAEDFADAEHSAIVLDVDPRSLHADEAELLLEFVGAGASLLMRMPSSAEGRAGIVLERMGVEPLEAEPHCFELALGAGRTHEICGGTRLGGDIEDSFSRLARHDDEAEGYWYGQAWYDQGRVVLVSDLDMLHNSALDDAEAVEVGAALLAPLLERERIHLFRGSDAEPFHVLVARLGWPILLPAFAALLLWLWMRSQRLGPRLPDAVQPRRALLEHVRASGEFLFRRGQPVAMHRAVLARVLKRIDERAPAIAALPAGERDAALSAQTGLSAAAIRAALDPVGLGRADLFLSSLSTLLQLERRL
jgi:hypothetical protein